MPLLALCLLFSLGNLEVEGECWILDIWPQLMLNIPPLYLETPLVMSILVICTYVDMSPRESYPGRDGPPGL